MSAEHHAGERDGRRGLPSWLAPRDREDEGSGRTRLVETTLLVLVGLALASATVNDLVRQVGVNHRLTADLNTWRAYTGHNYHNLSLDQELLGASSQREVVCGNTSPGPPGARTQICLAIRGGVLKGRRSVYGGWYLPPRVADVTAARYGCFGSPPPGTCPG